VAIPSRTVIITPIKKIKSTVLEIPKMSADTLYNWANALLIAALILGVVATYAIVVSGKIKERRFRKELSETYERAANAELQAAEAIQRAEEEKFARIKIKESIAWRRLSKDQQDILTSKLGRFSNQPVSLWYGAGDKEAETFAWEIATALHNAKWQVFSPASMVTMAESGHPFGSVSPQRTGITVSSTGDGSSREASQALVRELLALGFDATKSPKIEESDAPLVWVNIEVRPEGPQGQAKLRKHHK